MEQLDVAQRNGLITPNSFLTNSIATIRNSIQNRSLILKAIGFHIFTIMENGKEIRYATNASVLLTKDTFETILADFPMENCLITFFQEYVEKRFEIRVFYLYGCFYSMAIFSQGNEKTRVDYRNYDYERPNRNVPINLPLTMEKKITSFMGEMKLNSGSLDFIYGIDREFYFLEVNPIGQFDWLSKECNYYLDKQIAKELQNGIK